MMTGKGVAANASGGTSTKWLEWVSRRCCLLQLLPLLALALPAAVPQAQATQKEKAPDAPPPRTVRLIVRYGDGVEKHFVSLPWRPDMTVLDVLELARRHRRGIQFHYRGRGATAFLTRIDDLENEGNGRNWLYYINGKLGDRSFAVMPVRPGDTVLWTFSPAS